MNSFQKPDKNQTHWGMETEATGVMGCNGQTGVESFSSGPGENYSESMRGWFIYHQRMLITSLFCQGVKDLFRLEEPITEAYFAKGSQGFV
jgi:hypothetical protein